MAASIDRRWVNKEISDFNRCLGDYSMEGGEVERLAMNVAFHLRARSKIEEIEKHLEASRNPDSGKMDTNADEIVSLIYPESVQKESADAVVDKLLLEAETGSVWKDAATKIPRDGPADDAVMASFKTKNGELVFHKPTKGKQAGEWCGDSSAGPGFDIVGAFVSEHGGQCTHRLVGMFTLAADQDNATKISPSDLAIMVGGFGDDMPEETRRAEQLAKKYPNIDAAIRSLF